MCEAVLVGDLLLRLPYCTDVTFAKA